MTDKEFRELVETSKRQLKQTLSALSALQSEVEAGGGRVALRINEFEFQKACLNMTLENARINVMLSE